MPMLTHPDTTSSFVLPNLNKTTVPLDTQPSSRLSNFEFLESSQLTTPFTTTPSSLPEKKPSAVLPNVSLLAELDTMASKQVTLFHGDKDDENPEDFLRSFFRCMGTASNTVKKQQFPNFLQADSITNEWYKDLQPANTADWTAIKMAFRKHWPRKKAVKKTMEEYEDG